MKNVNFYTPSSKEQRKFGRKLLFILASLFILIILIVLCFVFFKYFAPSGLKSNKYFQIMGLGKIMKLTRSKNQVAEEKEGKAVRLTEQREDRIEKKEEAKEMPKLAKQGIEQGLPPLQMASTVKEKDSALRESAENKTEKEGDNNILLKHQQANPKSNYFIRVCSCIIKENSEGVSRKLVDLGYSPIIRNKKKQAMMYNVYSEIFTDKFEAENIQSSLQMEGFKPALVSLPDGNFTLRIDSCFYKGSAEEILKKLTNMGFGSRIVHEMTPTLMFIVLIEDFDSIKEAEETNDKLIKQGFETAMVSSVL